jgi:tetratricopeptide (TPR) repeat protein
MLTAWRGFVFNRIVAVGALVASSLFLDGPVSAQTQQQIDWCINKGNIFSHDLRINGCTASIQSGRWSGRELAWAFINRCWAYNDNGQPDRAIVDCDQAIQLNSQSAFAFNNRGISYGDKGQYDRAIQDYDQAIRLNPQYADAFNNRGFAYFNQRQYDRAIQDYDQAIRIDTNYMKALLNRGNSYFLAGNNDRAIADYDAVVRFNPKSAYGLYGRGMVKLKKGDDAGGNADIIVAKAIRANISEVFAKFDIQP